MEQHTEVDEFLAFTFGVLILISEYRVASYKTADVLGSKVPVKSIAESKLSSASGVIRIPDNKAN